MLAKIATKLFWRLTLGLLFAGLLLLPILAYQQTISKPFIPKENIDIKPDGSAWQGNRLVGRFFKSGNQLVIRLDVFDSHQEVVSLNKQVISFPEGIDSKELTVKFTSFQSTQNMSTVNNEGLLEVDFGNLLPGSHTELQISLPTGTPHIQLKPVTLLASRIIGTSLNTWIYIAFTMLLLGVFFYLGKTKQPPLNSRRKRPEPPEELTPLELGILTKGRIDSADIANLLFELCQRGFLEVISNNGQIIFLPTLRKGEIRPFEKDLLSLVTTKNNQDKPHNLEEILAYAQENIFSDVVSQMFVNAYKGLTAKGYLKENPRSIHLRYKTTGILIQFISLVQTIFAYILLSDISPGQMWLGLSGYILGYIVYQTGYRLVYPSTLGRKKLREIAGFKAFLSDSEPLNRKSRANLFFDYLPYAMALKVSKAWRERFGNIEIPIPDWYIPVNDNYTPDTFLYEVYKIHSALSRVLAKLKNPDVD